MNSRLFFLCASLAIALPEAAWAGTGGPSGSTMTIIGMLALIIIMLAVVLKKLF